MRNKRKAIEDVLRLNKKLKVIGFDDAPFDKNSDLSVHVSGIICSDTQFEGMLWGKVQRDGMDATKVLTRMLQASKFLQQLHAVLIDGLALGGFNVVDLEQLHRAIDLPCIAVMRKEPDLTAIKSALENVTEGDARWNLFQAAGEIYQINDQSKPLSLNYQVKGCNPEQAEQILSRVTAHGNVPEPLRLAHLIGAAVKTGQSNNRA